MQSNFILDILKIKGAFTHDFEVQVKIFKPNFLSFEWSNWDNLSAYQLEISWIFQNTSDFWS